MRIPLALTGAFLIAELVGAWLFNSHALLSNAAQSIRRDTCHSSMSGAR
ncbi:hypothetical protein [Sphingopyxis sp. YR583]|nr:hypothetical protein [Sphingopyxis sp. YR583]